MNLSNQRFQGVQSSICSAACCSKEVPQNTVMGVTGAIEITKEKLALSLRVYFRYPLRSWWVRAPLLPFCKDGSEDPKGSH